MVAGLNSTGAFSLWEGGKSSPRSCNEEREKAVYLDHTNSQDSRPQGWEANAKSAIAVLLRSANQTVTDPRVRTAYSSCGQPACHLFRFNRRHSRCLVSTPEPLLERSDPDCACIPSNWGVRSHG